MPKTLLALIKTLIDAYLGAKSTIAVLEQENAGLKAKLAARDAEDAEMSSTLDGILGAGGSMARVNE